MDFVSAPLEWERKRGEEEARCSRIPLSPLALLLPPLHSTRLNLALATLSRRSQLRPLALAPSPSPAAFSPPSLNMTPLPQSPSTSTARRDTGDEVFDEAMDEWAEAIEEVEEAEDQLEEEQEEQRYAQLSIFSSEWR